MDLKPGAHLAQRKRPGSTEQEKHQDLIAGEGETQGAQHGVDARQVDLLGPKHRGDRGHTIGGFGPAVHLPLPARFGDGVETQGADGRHGGGG